MFQSTFASLQFTFAFLKQASEDNVRDLREGRSLARAARITRAQKIRKKNCLFESAVAILQYRATY